MIASCSGNAQWGDINEFHNLLQNLLTKIKFTMEHSSKELPFLHVPTKNVNGQIITDTYHKPTDTQQYIHFKSHNSKSRIKSIPYTLARRIHKIITDKNLNKTCLQELHITLLRRGYPTTLINKGLKLAEKIPQKELRKQKKSNNEKPLAFVATYNKNKSELYTELMKNLEELKNKDKIKEIQVATKIIKSQR